MLFSNLLTQLKNFRLHDIEVKNLDLSPQELFEVKIFRYIDWFIQLRWIISILIIFASIFLRKNLTITIKPNIKVISVGLGLLIFNFLFVKIKKILRLNQ